MAFGVLGLALLVLWIGALVDVIIADADRCRNLPKIVWVLLVIFLGFIGALAWIFFGRPEGGAGRAPDARRQPPTRPVGIEDRPGWTAAPSTSATSRERSEELDRRLEEWEAEQRRRQAGDADT